MSARVARGGYILIEAAVTGVIVAVMMMGLVNLLGAARNDEVRAARKAIASDIALGQLAALQARGYAYLAAGTTTSSTSPPKSGRYDVTVTLTPGQETINIGAPTSTTVNLRFFDASVEVKFGVPPRAVLVNGRIYEAGLE